MDPSVYFSIRDQAVLNDMREFVRGVQSRYHHAHETKDEFFLTGDTLPFGLVLLIGAGGSGKTRLQCSIAEWSNVSFCASTNFAGYVLNQTLIDEGNINSAYSINTTTFNLLGLTPDTYEEILRLLYEGAPAHIRTGDVRSPAEFYAHVLPKLLKVCEKIYDNNIKKSIAVSNHKAILLSPEQYIKTRTALQFTASDDDDDDDDDLHERVIKHICGYKDVKDIPIPLIRNVYVIDESGRIEFSWIPIIAAYHFFIHYTFGTGKHTVPPVIVCVGSCTQSIVINNNAFDYPINNASMISCVTKMGLIDRNLLWIKQSKFNRRAKCGNGKKNAMVTKLVDFIETGVPVPVKFMDEFRQSTRLSKADYLKGNALHLCPTHDQCKFIINRNAVDSNKVITTDSLFTPCVSDKMFKTYPERLSKPQYDLGSSYKSLIYNNSGLWAKEKDLVVVNAPPLSRLSCFKKVKRAAKWMLTLNMYKNTPYVMTHNAIGNLTKISGSLRHFCADITDFENVIIKNNQLMLHVLKFMFETACELDIAASDPDIDRAQSKFVQYLNESKSDENDDGDDNGGTTNIKLSMLFVKLKPTYVKYVETKLEETANEHHHHELYVTTSKSVNFFLCANEIVQFVDLSAQSSDSAIVLAGKTFFLKLNKRISYVQKNVEEYDATRKKNGNKRMKMTESHYRDDDDDGDDIDPLIELKEFAESTDDRDRNEKKNVCVIFHFPLIDSCAQTIAKSQGASISREHYALWAKRNMTGQDAIVMCTRYTNVDDLHIYFENEEDKSSVGFIPLPKETLDALNFFHKHHMNKGFI